MTENISTHTSPRDDESLGDLVSHLSEQMTRLVRDELRLAQIEMAQKGKKAGLGAGMFGGAGLFAVFALGSWVAAAILALAGPLSGWLAAVLVGAGLLVIAGMSALLGRRQIRQAGSPVPAEAVEGVKHDVHTLRSGSA